MQDIQTIEFFMERSFENLIPGLLDFEDALFDMFVLRQFQNELP